jgi:hypothetical protein
MDKKALDRLVVEERDPGFEIDGDYLTIRWGGYDYDINLGRIDTPEKAARWVIHLGEKSTRAWPGMTPRRISILLGTLDSHFGWKLPHP